MSQVRKRKKEISEELSSFPHLAFKRLEAVFQHLPEN